MLSYDDEEPKFVTPQIKVQWISPTKLEVSVGRAYYIVLESESELSIRECWEHRDGPSTMTRRQYLKMHRGSAELHYENETGRPWDKDRGYIDPVRLVLGRTHSVILPAGFKVTIEPDIQTRVRYLKTGDEVYLTLEEIGERRKFKVDSIHCLKSADDN